MRCETLTSSVRVSHWSFAVPTIALSGYNFNVKAIQRPKSLASLVGLTRTSVPFSLSAPSRHRSWCTMARLILCYCIVGPAFICALNACHPNIVPRLRDRPTLTHPNGLGVTVLVIVRKTRSELLCRMDRVRPKGRLRHPQLILILRPV